jgi:hypothetical protein
MPILTEVAAMIEPTKKTTLAMRRMGFRPKISETLPHIGVDAAAESRYAEPIQV